MNCGRKICRYSDLGIADVGDQPRRNHYARTGAARASVERQSAAAGEDQPDSQIEEIECARPAKNRICQFGGRQQDGEAEGRRRPPDQAAKAYPQGGEQGAAWPLGRGGAQDERGVETGRDR